MRCHDVVKSSIPHTLGCVAPACYRQHLWTVFPPTFAPYAEAWLVMLVKFTKAIFFGGLYGLLRSSAWVTLCRAASVEGNKVSAASHRPARLCN